MAEGGTGSHLLDEMLLLGVKVPVHRPRPIAVLLLHIPKAGFVW